MEKVKKVMGEYKYALFLFLFLMAYGIIYLNGEINGIADGITYSIYAVDYSVGFCTRLLPGAVFNLLFDDINPQKATYYYYFLIAFCCLFFSFFANRLLKSFSKEQKRYGFIFILLGFTAFVVSSICGDIFSLLDLHWYVAAVFFFICVSDKKLYIFIPLTFIALILVQYASILCYVPMFALLMLFKITRCESKKEKYLLTVVFFISCIAALALTVYMLLFETSNIKMSMYEFIDFLKEKGGTVFYYYVFPFFRTVPEGIEWIATEEEINTYNFIEVDMNQPKIMIMIQTVLQQIQYNSVMAYHDGFLLDFAIYIPFIFFVYKLLFFMIRDKEATKIQKFVFLCTMLLFVIITVFGFLFSTDTARWFGHSVITVTALTTYYTACKDKYRMRLCDELRKIPLGLVILYGLFLFDYNFINFF